ncbi:LamG domain-containing protein [Draconibacterium mangrovi]|uniref:LamG domain-containing protein n=1 Tax=Draconibacterium mangrovi TaxID=2697469 RepID=UPI0013D7E7D9|nr:LamG domain-containing protein [Draconibacterium mangrovi]
MSKNSICHIAMLTGLLIFFTSIQSLAQIKKSEVVYIISDLIEANENVTVVGNPMEIDSPYGSAVQFDGKDDAIFIDEMPLKDLTEITIEMIIRFDSGGSHEQRYFHTGSVKKDRLLMEMRSNADTWYLDGMFESRKKWVVLMSPELIHPLDEWYHIAFTVKDGGQATFVNGQKELEGDVDFAPIKKGKTSIGVRQNKISWFKGAIYSIRITDKVLNPDEFNFSK